MTEKGSSEARALLAVKDLEAWYGESHILHGVTFEVHPGEVVTLLGRNGVGKTTTLKSIMGIVGHRSGSVRFASRELINLPSDAIARAGIAFCPEERGIFSSLDVRENLLLPPQVRHKQRQCGRSHAVDARGVTYRPRPVGLQLVARFVGETRQGRVIDAVGQDKVCVAPVGFDICRLAAQIDLVFGADFELIGDFAVQIAELRPDSLKIADPDIGIREQFEGRAPLAVLAQGEAMPCGLGRRQLFGGDTPAPPCACRGLGEPHTCHRVSGSIAALLMIAVRTRWLRRVISSAVRSDYCFRSIGRSRSVWS